MNTHRYYFTVLNRTIPQSSSGLASETERKIKSFGDLPLGWHYGKGGPVGSRAIEIALAYVWTFLSLSLIEMDAFPGADGEIMVAAYHGQHSIRITVELDSSFTVSHEFNGVSRFYETELSGVRASQELTRIASEIIGKECDTSGSFTPTTLIPARNSSPISHSKGRATEAALQSLKRVVVSKRVDVYARMSNVTIRISGETRLYSGRSTTQNSRVAA